MRIVLDGELGDWDGIPDLITDPVPEDTVDIGLVSLRAWDDPAWLYLALETDEPLNLQALPGTLHLLLDVDGDPATGLSVDRWGGAEIVLDMSPRPGGTDRAYGAGFGLRVSAGVEGLAGSPTVRSRNPYDIRVTALPTHSATAFELRLARRMIQAVPGPGEPGPGRTGPSGGQPVTGLPVLDTLVRVGVVAVAPDSAATVVDVLEPAVHRFRTAPGPDPFEPDLAPLRNRPPGSVRVAAWNVSEGRFRRPADHARILAAVRPDVILLDEVYEEVDDEALARFFDRPVLAELGTWSWVISRAGGRQKTVVAARNRRVRPEPTMEAVRYAPGALEALRRQVDSSFHRALAYEERVGMSATGAWVEVAPGVETLFVPVDLQSGGYDGSPQDVLRLLQAGTLKRYVGRAVAARMEVLAAGEGRAGAGGGATGEPGGAAAPGLPDTPPVVVAGDLNLVGARAPLDLLLAHRRDPYGPLETARLPRLDESTHVTWRSPRQALFGPGRLDFTLYSSETLEQVGGFVFAVDGLTDAQLEELGLERALAGTVSDHLVTVTDLRLRPGTD